MVSKTPRMVVLDHLNALATAYSQMADGTRAGTFARASSAIATKYKDALPENIDEIEDISGIGPSIMNEIKSALSTGTSKRLDNLKSEISERKVEESQAVANIRDKLRRMRESK